MIGPHLCKGVVVFCQEQLESNLIFCLFCLFYISIFLCMLHNHMAALRTLCIKKLTCDNIKGDSKRYI